MAWQKDERSQMKSQRSVTEDRLDVASGYEHLEVIGQAVNELKALTSLSWK
jgi:hypothetical protein